MARRQEFSIGRAIQWDLWTNVSQGEAPLRGSALDEVLKQSADIDCRNLKIFRTIVHPDS